MVMLLEFVRYRLIRLWRARVYSVYRRTTLNAYISRKKDGEHPGGQYLMNENKKLYQVENKSDKTLLCQNIDRVKT